MNREPTLLEEIAAYANTLTLDTMAPEVPRLAKTFFADACACLLAGADEEATRIVRQYAQARGAPGASTLLGTGGVQTDACTAAMVNGVALTVHEYDDINNTTIGHPSGPVLPAALAVGEELDATGAQVLLAYITGIEVYSLMGRAVSPEHNKQGWNSTGSLGIILVGATLSFTQLMASVRALPLILFNICLAFAVSFLVGRFLLKQSPNICAMVGGGTSICGGTAIAGAVRSVFPWFILGFIAMAVLNTFGLFSGDFLASFFKSGSKFFITSALVGVGFKMKFRALFTKGIKPLLLGGCTWLSVALSSMLFLHLFSAYVNSTNLFS